MSSVPYEGGSEKKKYGEIVSDRVEASKFGRA